MGSEKFVISTDIDDQFANLACRGMRYWRRVIIPTDCSFIVSSPKKGPRLDRQEIDYLESIFLTVDVWEAIRVCQSVPRGNANMDVTFRLRETNWQWRTEPVDTIFGSSQRSGTVVKTTSQHQLLLPARVNGDDLEIGKAIYVRPQANDKDL